MRQLYTALFYLLLPAVLLRLYWRGFKAPAYRRRWRERLGFYDSGAEQTNVIWFHAVSVGEAEAAFPLIRSVLARFPDSRILVTTTTPTGSARVQSVLGDQVEHVYLPYDLPGVVCRFLARFRPQLAVVMEKEVWPNLFAACAQRQIPLFVVNARLSERSAANYQKIPSLIGPALQCITQIATQTDEDRERFIQIGAEPTQLRVMGNLKFDVTIDAAVIESGQALKRDLFAGRFVWMLASSHHDEEARLLSVYRSLKATIPELVLMIAPRHPERFQTVANLCRDSGLAVATRSSSVAITAITDVYLADSMGELKMLYAAADVAFVGGSLVPVGGHNVLEPAAVGVPVLFGPEMFNFKEIAERMLQENAAVQCNNIEEVAAAIATLYREAEVRTALAENAKAFIARNQGATERIAEMLSHAL